MSENVDVQFIDARLCFALYSCSKAIIGAYKPHLSKAKITYPQYLVVMLLLEHGRLNVGEIGEHLFLDSGTLTPLLKKMEEQNLVLRARCSDDERIVNVTLTETGLNLSEDIARAQNAVSCSLGMKPVEITSIREQLKRLNLRLRAVGIE